MKYSLIFILIACGFILFRLRGAARAQHFEDVSRAYAPLAPAAALRGAFNISHCMTELLTCLEIIRGELVCHRARWQYAETACPLLREHCHDYYGDYDSYRHKFTMSEATCHSHYWFHEWT